MPRTSEQNEAMRLATLEKVEAAAIRLFARQGFAATNMRDIAREAGISTGSIYRHFTTKDELFGGLVAFAAEGLRRIGTLLRGDESPGALVDEYTRIVLAELGGDGGFADFFMIMNHAFVMPEAPAQVQLLVEQHSAMVDAFVGLVRRGQELGEFRAGEPVELATCYFATISGLAMLRFSLGNRLVVPSSSALTASLRKEPAR
ncbi:TetR/AcrR family transcriptional regulator [Actinoalloteichus hymeniacidonis]|uniref:Transcriptional regulator, TetR family n=1 Tax=Actinoalloteichus hymeniacidonis TaxID=340345 RepID=A0AAC9HT01_9PSEU|nr:TetR/AcrR family transcriptional regulator [Actinoalloteichus hymeniacidonis]AOS64810.1 transcriptional regulator, TetR family [Actinoalloteichus hymeniacidonis]MBB5907116.1 AcrR family transcriptional regulator [Actinoalloteichus hymeniacidonis]